MSGPAVTRIIETLIAVFLTVLVGFVLQRRKLPSADFWSGAEHLTYHLLLPCLLFSTIISARIEPSTLSGLVGPFVGPYLAMGALLFLFRHHLGRDYPAFTSLFQGTIRFNSYVGFSVALSVYGREGMALAAMFVALVIPVVNIMTVTVLAGAGKTPGPGVVFRELRRNPLIFACLLALLLKGLGVGLPAPLLDFAAILGRASLPLGLMAVGAALGFRRSADDFFALSFVCLSRLLLMPTLMYLSCQLFGVSGLARAIAVLFSALPGSPAAYILARQMGGDHRLMANLTTAQILVSFVTLPLVLALEATLSP
jgi:predicted permease